jgi:hypothetical protein
MAAVVLDGNAKKAKEKEAKKDKRQAKRAAPSTTKRTRKAPNQLEAMAGNTDSEDEAQEDNSLESDAMTSAPRPRKRRAMGGMFGRLSTEVPMIRQTAVADPTKVVERTSVEEMRNRLLVEANEIWTFPENHHVYRCPDTGLDFNIHLTRIDIRKNTMEHAYVRLYESNAAPATYAVYAKVVALNGATKEEAVLVPVGSNFGVAFERFCEKFEELTFVDWKHRLAAEGSVEPRKVVVGGQEVMVKPFTYINKTPIA